MIIFIVRPAGSSTTGRAHRPLACHSVGPKENPLSVPTIQQYVHPETVEEAFAALGEGVRPIGGGTHLMLHAPPDTAVLVDLSGLPLSHIEQTPAGFRVGATATLTAMLEHPGLAAHLGGVLPEMLVHVGSPLLRNAATLGGHLARGRLSDVIPVLIALDSSIRWFDGEYREATLETFLAEGVYRNQMLITEVTVPAIRPPAAASFLKFSRTFFDVALLNCSCALRLEEEAIAWARVAVGETPAVGARVPAAEASLLGRPADSGAFAEAARIARETVPTSGDGRAGADYRTQLVGVAVERCLQTAADRLEAAS
jgi:CO/xanthine dehydrogenase FAD-binding subunit